MFVVSIFVVGGGGNYVVYVLFVSSMTQCVCLVFAYFFVCFEAFRGVDNCGFVVALPW